MIPLLRLRVNALFARAKGWFVRQPPNVRAGIAGAFLLAAALTSAGVLLLFGGGSLTPFGEPTPNAVGGTPYPVPPQAVQGQLFRVPPLMAFANFRLEIDSIGVNARVLRMGLDEKRVPQVPYDAYKAAWYEFTSVPGAGSNAVFAGHVRWGGQVGVFARLSKLEDGDIIRVRFDDGKILSYEVVDNTKVKVSDRKAVQVMSPTAEDMLTLITCAGTFVPNADNPLGGDFSHRIVVRAQLQPAPSVAALRY